MRRVQVMFRGWTVPEDIAWVMMILLLKEEGGYQGIGIVEVLWKV